MPRLLKGARKDFDRLPADLSGRAVELLRRLDDEPSLGKKLQGPYKGRRSARLGCTHRVLYRLHEGEVIVEAIVARKDSYR